MYEVKVILDFSAAHSLRDYKGKCENLHGHNWKVEISVLSQELNKAGMVIDFKELKKRVNSILEKLDHKNLNDLVYFKKVNPTSENIARYIYDKSSDQRTVTGDQMLKVTVWESDTACAVYTQSRDMSLQGRT